MKKIKAEHVVISTTEYKHPKWELKPAVEVQLQVIDPEKLNFGSRSVEIKIVFSNQEREEETAITLDDCIDEREISRESVVSVREILDSACIWGANQTINALCMNALMERARLEIELCDDETEIRIFVGSYATSKRVPTKEVRKYVKFNK